MNKLESKEIEQFEHFLNLEKDIDKLKATEKNIQTVIRMTPNKERKAILSFKVNKIKARIKELLK